jgi:hypothetical protein
MTAWIDGCISSFQRKSNTSEVKGIFSSLDAAAIFVDKGIIDFSSNLSKVVSGICLSQRDRSIFTDGCISSFQRKSNTSEVKGIFSSLDAAAIFVDKGTALFCIISSICEKLGTSNKEHARSEPYSQRSDSSNVGILTENFLFEGSVCFIFFLAN